MSSYHNNPVPNQNSHQEQCMKDEDILPFFPKYEIELLCQDKLLVVWFEADFSQARYNLDSDNQSSNACTLIAILMSSYCVSEKIQARCLNNHVSYSVVRAFGFAILKGNEIYNTLKCSGQLPNVNLSIPEAIQCAGLIARGIKEWKSAIYMQTLSTSLANNIEKNLEEWCSTSHCLKHNYLFIILICASRSVLFIVNNKDNTISLVDSHQHSDNKGASIAIVTRENISCLCRWFAHVLQYYHRSKPRLYELSFLYFRRK